MFMTLYFPVVYEVKIYNGNKQACICSHSAVYAAPKSGQWAYSSRLVGPAHHLGPGSHWFYNSRVLSPANLERLDPGPLTRSTSCAPPPRHAGVSPPLHLLQL